MCILDTYKILPLLGLNETADDLVVFPTVKAASTSTSALTIAITIVVVTLSIIPVVSPVVIVVSVIPVVVVPIISVVAAVSRSEVHAIIKTLRG